MIPRGSDGPVASVAPGQEHGQPDAGGRDRRRDDPVRHAAARPPHASLEARTRRRLLLWRRLRLHGHRSHGLDLRRRQDERRRRRLLDDRRPEPLRQLLEVAVRVGVGHADPLRDLFADQAVGLVVVEAATDRLVTDGQDPLARVGERDRRRDARGRHDLLDRRAHGLLWRLLRQRPEAGLRLCVERLDLVRGDAVGDRRLLDLRHGVRREEGFGQRRTERAVEQATDHVDAEPRVCPLAGHLTEDLVDGALLCLELRLVVRDHGGRSLDLRDVRSTQRRALLLGHGQPAALRLVGRRVRWHLEEAGWRGRLTHACLTVTPAVRDADPEVGESDEAHGVSLLTRLYVWNRQGVMDRCDVRARTPLRACALPWRLSVGRAPCSLRSSRRSRRTYVVRIRVRTTT